MSTTHTTLSISRDTQMPVDDSGSGCVLLLAHVPALCSASRTWRIHVSSLADADETGMAADSGVQYPARGRHRRLGSCLWGGAARRRVGDDRHRGIVRALSRRIGLHAVVLRTDVNRGERARSLAPVHRPAIDSRRGKPPAVPDDAADFLPALPDARIADPALPFLVRARSSAVRPPLPAHRQRAGRLATGSRRDPSRQ